VTVPAWARHLPPGVEAAGVELLAAGSLPRAWARRWAERPQAPAIRTDATGWVTGEELEARSAESAALLAGIGVQPGDRVLMSAAASLDLVAFHVGALRLGAVVVPANTAYLEAELGHLVTDADPVAVVLDRAERAAWARRAATGALAVVEIGEDHRPVVTTGGRRPVPVELDVTGPDDPALICYTSGTTGRPKGALLTHGNLLASAEALRLAWRWSRDDRLVLALPLFHLHGLGVGLHGTLLVGASMVLLPRFEPDLVLDAAREHGATLFFGVPTMYARLADSPRLAELAPLRLCVSGSAPLPPVVFERIAAGGGQRVLERYGMTETVMNVSNPYDGERRPGTVGLPLPGVDLRLAEADGEIQVRGPNVFPGYWRNPAATAESFADGWFRTGDIGEFDADGYLRIVGRSRELIITGGYNVYPREVEDALLTHPAVADAAAVGMPDDEWGEVVTAFVVPGAPVTETELLDHCRARLAAYKRPRIVHLVDALPRNALGKVRRDALRAG